MATLVSGCATTPKTPPAQPLALGKWSAQWRDYSDVDVCLQDRARLANELDGMNQLLAEFLACTAAGYDGVWADEHLEVLEQGRQKLAPALAAYEPLLTRLAQCELPEDSELTDRVHAGNELTRQAVKRVRTAADVGAYARGRQAVEQWREAQGQRQASARATTCAGARKPEIFYASEEAGHTQWLFCDGAKAVRTGTAVEVVAQDPRRKPPKKTKPHLDAVSAYPADLILHAPKAPPPPPERLAKPEDKFDLNAPLDDQG